MAKKGRPKQETNESKTGSPYYDLLYAIYVQAIKDLTDKNKYNRTDSIIFILDNFKPLTAKRILMEKGHYEPYMIERFKKGDYTLA